VGVYASEIYAYAMEGRQRKGLLSQWAREVVELVGEFWDGLKVEEEDWRWRWRCRDEKLEVMVCI